MEEKTIEKVGTKITISEDLCIGCGSCEAVAPEHFELKDDGKSYVKKQYTSEDDKIIEEAAGSCPVKAIEISKE